MYEHFQISTNSPKNGLPDWQGMSKIWDMTLVSVLACGTSLSLLQNIFYINMSPLSILLFPPKKYCCIQDQTLMQSVSLGTNETSPLIYYSGQEILIKNHNVILAFSSTRKQAPHLLQHQLESPGQWIQCGANPTRIQPSFQVRGRKKIFHVFRYYIIRHFPKKTSIRHTLSIIKISSPSSRSTHCHCSSANGPSQFSLHQSKSGVVWIGQRALKK